MHIAIKASQLQQTHIAPLVPEHVTISWVEQVVPAADVYMDLLFEEEGAAFAQISDKPVFVSAVLITTTSLPSNYIRLNAWNTFLQRPVWEVAGNETVVASVFHTLGWKYVMVPDTIGMIAARSVAMIINEAYFALGDKVSSKEDIDTAMKLGTNYPYGPFEWSEQIGLHRIYQLLRKLSHEDKRYIPASALEQELKAIAG
jgi:3-hydroxybutyryl-CoA dehydrogenase